MDANFKHIHKILRITGADFPEYSVNRGIRQSLEPDQTSGGFLRRTVNGELISMKLGNTIKYKSSIVGDDIIPPAISNLYIGKRLTIHCVEFIGQMIEIANKTISLPLNRQPVENSKGIITTSDGSYHADIDFVCGTAVIKENILNNIDVQKYATLYYLPKMEMMVESWTSETTEWNKSRHWVLKLLEV